jgi:ubiquinone/menaquinone biosynthesis C-methylase UbiE
MAEIDADAFNAFEAAGWEARAVGYDHFFGAFTSRLVDPLLDAAEVGPGVRTLDVASGPGYAAAQAAERGASVVGVDIAEAMTALASRLHPQVEFVYGNAEALPFTDESFDAVVGNFALLHLGRPEQAAAEFVRVLKPGGRLALTVWDAPEQARFLGVFLEAVAAAEAGPPDDIPHGPPFFRFSEEQEFARLLNEQQLEEIQVRTIAFPHSFGSPDEFWDGLLGGTVRMSALVSGQTEAVQREIRAGFDQAVEPYRVDDRLELPVSVKLASGRKASA